MRKKSLALLLLVLGAIATLHVADRALSGERDLYGFEDIKKPQLYYFEQKMSGHDSIKWWGYVDLVGNNHVPGVAVLRWCGAGDGIPRLVKVTDLQAADGVCLFTDRAHSKPEDLLTEIFSVKASGPDGATLERIISFRDPADPPDTVEADEWKDLEDRYGGEIPAGTYLGRDMQTGRFFLVAASVADIRF
jgi:hypothetical protein